MKRAYFLSRAGGNVDQVEEGREGQGEDEGTHLLVVCGGRGAEGWGLVDGLREVVPRRFRCLSTVRHAIFGHEKKYHQRNTDPLPHSQGPSFGCFFEKQTS